MRTRAEGSARKVLSAVLSADKSSQILRSNIWNSRNSLWACFCLSYFPGLWSSQSPISERAPPGGPSSPRRSLRKGKQPGGRLERAISKAQWAVLVSPARAGKEVETTAAREGKQLAGHQRRERGTRVRIPSLVLLL